ncbi:MAG: hypothetical protein IPM29_17880 [Planctomycetes bacterium]|nr:hypothetical protein [Planctomycetota bacterium]
MTRAELLVVPPPGPLAWLWPELLDLESAAPTGDDVLDLRALWLTPSDVLAVAAGRDVVVPAGPRGATVAALLRSAARLAGDHGAALRVHCVQGVGPRPLEHVLLDRAEPLPHDELAGLHRIDLPTHPAIGRATAAEPRRVWFFATRDDHQPAAVHTRLAPAWWGVLPGDLWPAAARRSWLDLLQREAPQRRLAFLDLENAALAGIDLFAESLARPAALPLPTPAAGPIVLGIDGIDGAGKSSHLAMLERWLGRELGLSVARLKMYRHGVFHDTVTDMTRACAGDHHLHLWPLQRHAKLLDSLKYHCEVVDAAAADHDVLLFDRYVQTHLAAGAGRFHHDPYARELLCGLPRADVVFVLDVPVETAVARLRERPELTVDENPYMLSRFRAALLDLAHVEDWPVLDAEQPFEANRDRIRIAVERVLHARRPARVPTPAATPAPDPLATDFSLAASWEVIVDADPAARTLVPRQGRFAAALRRVPAYARRTLPDQLVLQLYAYEVVERLRDLQRQDGRPRRLTLPLCPLAACAAADLRAHAGHELRAMWPTGTRVVVRQQPAAVVAAASLALFGELRFDPDAYCRILAMGG